MRHFLNCFFKEKNNNPNQLINSSSAAGWERWALLQPGGTARPQGMAAGRSCEARRCSEPGVSRQGGSVLPGQQPAQGCSAGFRRAQSTAGPSWLRGPGATARPRTGQENAAFPGKTHRISCSGSRKHTFPLSPPCHGESLCSAGDNVNSCPGNQGKQGALFGILREAAARLPQQTGLALAGPAALMATNEPPSLAVGWPRRWKICGSPREKKKISI